MHDVLSADEDVANGQAGADRAGPLKSLIEEEPPFGYRTVAGLLGMSKNMVQGIMGWRVRKRAASNGSRIQALPSVATAPNQRGQRPDITSTISPASTIRRLRV